MLLTLADSEEFSVSFVSLEELLHMLPAVQWGIFGYEGQAFVEGAAGQQSSALSEFDLELWVVFTSALQPAQHREQFIEERRESLS